MLLNGIISLYMTGNRQDEVRAKWEHIRAYDTANVYFKTVTSTISITNKCQVRTLHIKVYYK